MEIQRKNKLLIFIDAENISPYGLESILSLCADSGNIHRIYVVSNFLEQWATTIREQHHVSKFRIKIVKTNDTSQNASDKKILSLIMKALITHNSPTTKIIVATDDKGLILNCRRTIPPHIHLEIYCRDIATKVKLHTKGSAGQSQITFRDIKILGRIDENFGAEKAFEKQKNLTIRRNIKKAIDCIESSGKEPSLKSIQKAVKNFADKDISIESIQHIVRLFPETFKANRKNIVRVTACSEETNNKIKKHRNKTLTHRTFTMEALKNSSEMP